MGLAEKEIVFEYLEAKATAKARTDADSLRE
jgi:hypothetical protein